MTTTSETHPASGVFLARAEPQLLVVDIEASCAYYVERLGFHIRFRYGEPPFYAQVERDQARLNLRHVDRLPHAPQLRHEMQLLSATIVVNDASALFGEYRQRGVAFHQVLETKAWGARTFVVEDPDGNLISFAQ